MRNAIAVDLIYKEKVHDADDIEHERLKIKAFKQNPTLNRTYQNMELGLVTTTTLYIKRHYTLPYENGELTYVRIDGKKYKINIISEIKGEYSYLNIGELC